jgi:hypothetical protein
MLDNQDLEATPDAADDPVAPTLPASDDTSPTDDPYGLSGLTFADLPSQPGDGVFGGVMRQMAANGHPGLQAWAASDAAQQAGASGQQQLLACYTKPMTVTAYDVHGPGKDWTYWKNHPEGVGPGTVAVANTDPQPYPSGPLSSFETRMGQRPIPERR